MRPLGNMITSLKFAYDLTGNDGRTLPSGPLFYLLAFNLDGLNFAITAFLKNDTFTNMLVEMDKESG